MGTSDQQRQLLQGMYDTEYIAVINNYLEYSLDDNHTLNLSFQSTSIHVFHAASVYKMLCVGKDTDIVFILVDIL